MLKNRFLAQDNSDVEKQLFVEVDTMLITLLKEYNVTATKFTPEYKKWLKDSFKHIDAIVEQTKYKEFNRYNWLKYISTFHEDYFKESKSLPDAYKKYKLKLDKEIISIGIAYAYAQGLSDKDFSLRLGDSLTELGSAWFINVQKEYNKLRLKYGMDTVTSTNKDFDIILKDIFKRYLNSLKDKNAKDVNFENSVVYLAQKLYNSIYESRIPSIVRNYVKDIKFVPVYKGGGSNSNTVAYVKFDTVGVIYLNLDALHTKEGSFNNYFDLGQVIAHEVWHLFRYKSGFEKKLSTHLNMLFRQMFNLNQTLVDSLENMIGLLNKQGGKSFKLGSKTYVLNTYQDMFSFSDILAAYIRDIIKKSKLLAISSLEYKKLDKEYQRMKSLVVKVDEAVEIAYDNFKSLGYTLEDINKSFKKNIKPYMSLLQNLLYSVEEPNQDKITAILAAWDKDYSLDYLKDTFSELDNKGMLKVLKKQQDYLQLIMSFISKINIWIGKLDELMAESFGDMVAGKSNRSVNFIVSFLNQLFMSRKEVSSKVILKKFVTTRLNYDN